MVFLASRSRWPAAEREFSAGRGGMDHQARAGWRKFYRRLSEVKKI
jgi:hypothetical protein